MQVGSANRDERWYRDGLRFECTTCGKCCAGHEGGVWIDESEAAEIAAALGTTLRDFLPRHTRPAGERHILTRHPRTGSCVFLRGKRCAVYDVRPRQCRTFPFWPNHLASPAGWLEAADRCEGIHPGARWIPANDVDELSLTGTRDRD